METSQEHCWQLPPQIPGAKIGLFITQMHSQKDKKFLKIVSEGTRHTNDNHYEIPLPFRSEAPWFPENRKEVPQRARWLKRWSTRSETFYQDHVTFINGVVTKIFARKVPSDLPSPKTGEVWYITQHGIYSAWKPNKIQVVFDRSVRFGGISLNERYLQGPDLTNRLVGVLTRFHQGPIAFMGDIDAIFHQVWVPENQRNLFRFL